MFDIYEIRRANTALLLKEVFKDVKAHLAEKLEVQPSYVTRIVKPGASGARGIGDDLARRIEKAGGKRENWLDQQHQVIEGATVGDAGSVSAKVFGDVISAHSRGRVPVVSWVIAGSWASIDDHFLPPEDYEWLETTERLTEKEAIALVVENDSMYKEGDDRSFPPGCIIVIKRPDVRPPRAGDFVVVRLENEQRSTFKQLMYDGDQMYLRPLNPNYPTIKVDKPATFVGVVCEKILRSRY